MSDSKNNVDDSLKDGAEAGLAEVKKPPMSKKKLLTYFGAAYLGAGILLVAAVLPAEYGIDPFGIGKATGISKLSGAGLDTDVKKAAIEAALVPAPDGSYFERPNELKKKTLKIKIEDLGEVEHKLLMEEGDTVVFNWTVTDGPLEEGVYFDFHGHPASIDKDDFPENFVQSYKTGEGLSGGGGFTAPFSGYHGLYLMNLEYGAIEVEWEISGYWDKDIELYRVVNGEVVTQVDY